jgi:hypothetical protein
MDRRNGVEHPMACYIPVKDFTDQFFTILDETFEQVHGVYLDGGTSLFETLAGISAEQASRPVGVRCACIAAQVDHVTFYLHVLQRYMRHEEVGSIDWQASWQRTGATAEEWEELKQKLREAYQQVLALTRGFDRWEGEHELGGALAILVHTAYHLGEIRQALCTVG